MKETINIIGAGPAGLTSAIVLRRHGFPVRVFEKQDEVGRRFHGDFQGLENWSSRTDVLDEFAHIGIDASFEHEPFTGGTIITPLGGDSIEARSEKPLFYLVKRGPLPGTLDMALKEQAVSMGAEIVFNSKVDVFKEKAIVATGPREGDVIAVGYTFDTDSEKQAVVIFDDEIAPKGYAYLLIHNGQGTVASVPFRNFRAAGEYRDRCLSFVREQLGIDVKNEIKFAGYGNFYLRDTQIGHGKIYVGEAAGFQDSLWGFGIRYAVQSGYLAAVSIIEGTDYDSLWKDLLKPRLETSFVNRYLFEKLGRRGYAYMSKKLARGDSSEILREQYNSSSLKRILHPLAAARHKSKLVDSDCADASCDCIVCRCREYGSNGRKFRHKREGGPVSSQGSSRDSV